MIHVLFSNFSPETQITVGFLPHISQGFEGLRLTYAACSLD